MDMHLERLFVIGKDVWNSPLKCDLCMPLNHSGTHGNALIHWSLLLLMISTVACHSNTCFVSSTCKEELGDGLRELGERKCKNVSSRTWEVNESISEPACLLEGTSDISVVHPMDHP